MQCYCTRLFEYCIDSNFRGKTLVISWFLFRNKYFVIKVSWSLEYFVMLIYTVGDSSLPHVTKYSWKFFLWFHLESRKLQKFSTSKVTVSFKEEYPKSIVTDLHTSMKPEVAFTEAIKFHKVKQKWTSLNNLQVNWLDTPIFSKAAQLL